MNHASVHLSIVDYTILALYIVFVIGIGFALKRQMKTSADFFLSGRNIPASNGPVIEEVPPTATTIKK